MAKPGQKKTKKKATRAAMKSRIEEVGGLLLQGYSRSQILRLSATKWKLSTRQTDEYIHQATLEIDEANEASAERNLALITSDLWDLYRKNVAYRPGLARQALMDIAKLRGLHKIELVLTPERPLKDVSDEELAEALGGL